MRYLSLLFLIGFTALLLTWMARSPAYTSSLRIQTAGGGTILADTSAMYDQAEYLFEVGYSYVVPDLDLFLDLDLDAPLDSPILTFEETQLRAQKGIQYLEESLALAPANAHAWMTLAWGRAISGGIADDVFTPLRRSWALAPHDRLLADRRISLLTTVLLEEPEAEATLTDSDHEAIAKDLAILRKFDPGTLEEILEISPGVTFLDG